MSFTAFQIIRASQLNTEISAYAPKYILRPSDQALISTTLTNDAVMYLPGLTASMNYHLDCYLLYRASTTADFKLAFTCSGSGSTLTWAAFGPDSVQNALTGTWYNGNNAIAGAAIYGGTGPAQDTVGRPSGTLYTGTGTNITLQMQWCQATADAVNGSTLRQSALVKLTLMGP